MCSLNLFFYLPIASIVSVFAIWIYLSTETIPCLISIDDAQQKSFDFIIVGAGSAGCVLANRLSENGRFTVLLIEAGTTFTPWSMVPLLASQQQRTQVDWQFQTTSQKHSSNGFTDNIQFLPRGKGLGGSSQLNYLLHYDGNARDFERWKANGQDSDLWMNVENHENINSKRNSKIGDGTECKSSNKHCSSDNANFEKSHENSFFKTNLHTTPLTYDYSKLSSAFVDASIELQLNLNETFDYYLAKYNTLNGLRHTTYHSYLKPAFERSNLKILLSSRVHRVKFNDRKQATHVVVSDDKFNREAVTIRAKREIILSAGAFHSPQLLKLSGIGPAKELRRYKIPLQQDSPKVGRNLFDHVYVPLYVTVNDTMTITQGKVLSVGEVLNYLLYGEGIFSNFGVIGYLNALNDDRCVGIFGVGTIDERVLRKIVNFDSDVFRKNYPFYNDSTQEGFVLLHTCNQPTSRGTVNLYSNHIRHQPEINPNYLQNQSDADCLVRSIRLAIDFLSTHAFRKVNATIHWPQFDQCKNFNDESYVSDRYLECVVRMTGLTAHHPGGTCSIGETNDSVLDKHMRVRGVRKLRVVDGSVFVSPVSGTPHASIVALAEHAAHIILSNILYY